MSDTRFPPTDRFCDRHIGPRADEVAAMLAALGYKNIAAFIDAALPAQIRTREPLAVGAALSEDAVLDALKEIGTQNQPFRSYLGMGYHDCVTPRVIQRNILKDPGWYTQYTPYQAEIAQGRLEALLNFQTMIADLTGLAVANASLLDEATAAAEAMTLCCHLDDGKEHAFFVSEQCHPQTIAVVQTRAAPLGIHVLVGAHTEWDFSRRVGGVLVQYPTTDGTICDYGPFIDKAHAAGALAVVAADPLCLTLLRPPGEFGADVAIGSTQRFGVPLGYGGPHAAYFATKPEFRRLVPGRIVGVSIDAAGDPALRLALQTREQHIRRAKATSNICTAQVLLAIMASMYAVYHGPEGLRAIAERIHGMAVYLAEAVRRLGFRVPSACFFDTIRVEGEPRAIEAVYTNAQARQINLRRLTPEALGIALDETTRDEHLEELLACFQRIGTVPISEATRAPVIDPPHSRTSPYLTHPVFHQYRSETEMLRYIERLRAKDLSLTTSMIPLGSCTMKLNATVELNPITWPAFSRPHPFAPVEQAKGYRLLIDRLEAMLKTITGFDAFSFQPNAGSQGEYTGLLVIRAYHRSRGEGERTICLIPASAHGTNPASAVMAGMQVVEIGCDREGNISLEDLRAKAKTHGKQLAALMITYPSTHGVFEGGVEEMCATVHAHGGQVYLDGANMNALVGLSKPAAFGADVGHVNLHKTFCIPHGGGGPGMGPIGVKRHLAPFLPTHPVIPMGGEQSIGTIAAAPWGSPGILPISYAYIAMMGSEGLTRATAVAILNANYIAKRLAPHYPVVFTGQHGLVAHECIIDCRPFKGTGIEVEDMAKRLMDYGFHAPTISWPIAGTMMIEPTESESLPEIDRFCDAMIRIRAEIEAIADGKADRVDNVLKNAPHTARMVASDRWTHPYTRAEAVFPAPWLTNRKFWPPVARINNPYGDRHLVCTCPPSA